MPRQPVPSGFLTAMRAATEQFASVPDAEWEHVATEVTGRHVRKGDHLFDIGDPVRHMYFIHQGALRVYYLRDGREHTRSFAFENRFYTNSYSALTQTPSHYAVEALEDTVLTVLPYTVIEAAYDRHPGWERVGRRLSELNFVAKERKEMEEGFSKSCHIVDG